MLSEMLLDNIIGPSAVYKFEKGEFRLIQTNGPYRELAGLDAPSEVSLQDEFLSANKETIAKLIHEADAMPFEGAVGIVGTHRGDMEIRLFLLYTSEQYRLYFMTMGEAG